MAACKACNEIVGVLDLENGLCNQCISNGDKPQKDTDSGKLQKDTDVMSVGNYSAHPAMFRANPIMFLIAIALIFVFGLGLIILIFWYLRTKATKVTVTSDEILYEKGLMSKERIDLQIDKVKSLKVKQGFFDRIFGVGDIEIYTTGDIPEFIVHSMPKPQRLRDSIKQSRK